MTMQSIFCQSRRKNPFVYKAFRNPRVNPYFIGHMQTVQTQIMPRLIRISAVCLQNVQIKILIMMKNLKM